MKKHVTFKTPALPQSQSQPPSQKAPISLNSMASMDPLGRALSKLHEISKIEARTKKLVMDVKELLIKYHEQNLMRYKLEMQMKQKMDDLEHLKQALKEVEEKKIRYLEITAPFRNQQ
ncbi:hypothetical protein DdX_04660 [Ditylenchus destructor]|uniref:Uncharacterized protein n=1 Tax=Ditylenchus destructor TaxID=166010 RepID=A0AAD4RB78_9BILA|nr:hypothetical protein DdX_04660 [Ditylenchus destructor]